MKMTGLLKQPEINIGTAGHVDHGKTTLVKGLTGIWASRHSEELRRGITIKLGYADCAFYKCPRCPPPDCYQASEKCAHCGGLTEFLRAVSFVDCPGHEVLMTTMLSGAAVMDGALLVIAADEPVPKPQTREHVAALEITGVKRIVVVQNKIDVIEREKSVENYNAIKKFLAGTVAEEAPIIPISAQRMVNVDLLIESIEKTIPTPPRDPSKPPFAYTVRSFDINKPGTRVEDMAGGVLGGTIVEGVLKVGDEIEIKPGLRIEKAAKAEYQSLVTKVTTLFAGGKNVETASSGGLVGIGTQLDPSLTKADGLIGNVIGKPDKLPPLWENLTVEVFLFDNVIGTPELVKVEMIKPNEVLVVNIGTAVTSGTVSALKKNRIEIALKKPISAKVDSRVSLNRKVAGKWRLIGYGIVK